MEEFQSLGIREDLARALASFGFEGPTEIQRRTVPALLAGQDAFVSSSTGTGKTFGYLVPLLQLAPGETRKPFALIVAPTHELAVQVEKELDRLAAAAGIRTQTVLLIGSAQARRQAERLRKGGSFVIGTPGRVRDLAAARELDLSGLSFLVLDEADRLFEKEALAETSDILDGLPEACCRVLVSATLPDRVRDKAAPWFRSPEALVLDNSEVLRENIDHWVFHSSSRRKIDFLRRFEAAVRPKRCLVFASSNAQIFNILRKLEYLEFPAAELRSQGDKERRKLALDDFREGRVRYLVTSDLGARGMDVKGIDYVLCMDLPEEPTVYMHRAGRTGRAGERGVSVLVADIVELKRASKVAVRYGFSFQCRILEGGEVHEIDPENFFALAEEEEADRAVKPPLEAKRFSDMDGRRSRVRPVPSAGAPAGTRPRKTRAGSPSPRQESRRPDGPPGPGKPRPAGRKDNRRRRSGPS
jgi:superfamily II DNA/RNA helicase